MLCVFCFRFTAYDDYSDNYGDTTIDYYYDETTDYQTEPPYTVKPSYTTTKPYVRPYPQATGYPTKASYVSTKYPSVTTGYFKPYYPTKAALYTTTKYPYVTKTTGKYVPTTKYPTPKTTYVPPPTTTPYFPPPTTYAPTPYVDPPYKGDYGFFGSLATFDDYYASIAMLGTIWLDLVTSLPSETTGICSIFGEGGSIDGVIRLTPDQVRFYYHHFTADISLRFGYIDLLFGKTSVYTPL